MPPQDSMGCMIKIGSKLQVTLTCIRDVAILYIIMTYMLHQDSR